MPLKTPCSIQRHLQLRLPAFISCSVLSTNVTQSQKILLGQREVSPGTAAVTQHGNRSPSKGCLFPKTLRLGNSSNNITKHIILTEPAERQLQTEPQVLHTQDSGTGQGNTQWLVCFTLITLYTIKFSPKSRAKGGKNWGGIITSTLKQHRACWRSRWVDS